MVRGRSRFGRHVPRSINWEPGRIEALNHAKDWIKTVLNEEASGTSGGTEGCRVTPSRLLKMNVNANGGPKGLCLVETKLIDETALYAALSYCWGGQQEFQLKTATKLQYSRGLSIENLPKILRDAIIVTAHLEISYLLIDVLCIFQDGAQDMRKELAIMSEIYENAIVTIAASRTKSADEGFLQERLPFKDTAETSFVLPCIELFDMS